MKRPSPPRPTRRRSAPRPEAVRLSALLASFAQLRVVVWGDFVADEFLEGEIARVSREAPVLILKHRASSVVAGGAGNAALNLAALGVRVALVGALGADASGAQLRQLFASHGVATGGLLTLPRRITPTKTRILAHHAHTAPQQVVRVDREPSGLAASAQARLAATAARAAQAADALLLSDYGYGSVTPALAAQVRGKLGPNALTSVDARYQIGAYRGCSAATPNEAELEAALGVRVDGDRAVLERAGRALRSRLGCEHLLVTRGRDGMALFEPGQPLRTLAVHGSNQALDVTGAGDTVIAVFTAALAAGASGLDAARLANLAGGLVVMKRGTATVSVAELQEALRGSRAATPGD